MRALMLMLVVACSVDAGFGRRRHGHRFVDDIEASDDAPKPGARHEHRTRSRHEHQKFSMKHLCRGDMNKLCGGHEARDGAEKEAPGSCLEENVDKIADAKCKAAMVKRVACKEDVKRLCPEDAKGHGGKGKGGDRQGWGSYKLKCLSGHADQLSDSCKAAQPCLADMKKHCYKFSQTMRWQWKCLAGVSSDKLTPKCNAEVAGWKGKKAAWAKNGSHDSFVDAGDGASVAHRRRLSISGDTQALLVGVLAGVLSTLCVLLVYRHCNGMRGERGPRGAAFNKVSSEELSEVQQATQSVAVCSIAVAYPVDRPVSGLVSTARPAVPPPTYSSLREGKAASPSGPETEAAEPPSFHRGAVATTHPNFTKLPTTGSI
jgi:hypothetical protein